MKVQRWYKSALATTAMVAMVGCGSGSGGGSTPAVEDGSGPDFRSAQTASVNENTVDVLTLDATDVSEPISFSIGESGADGAKFIIDENNRLKFALAPDYDVPDSAEKTNEYVVAVIATDSEGNKSTQTITVTVVSTGAPGIISNDLVSIDENTKVVTTVIAQGEDGGTPVLSLSGGADKDLFSFDSATGVLSFKIAPDYEDPQDSGADNVYNVIMTATQGVESVTQDMVITVKNVGSTALSIESAVYDVADTKLHVFFSTQIDQDSGSASSFAFSNSESITGTLSYPEGLPYEFTVDGELTGYVAGTTKIKVVDGGFTIDDNQVNASVFVPVTVRQKVVKEGNRKLVANGDIVEDNDFSLEWQKEDPAHLNDSLKKTWVDAKEYCADLTLGSHDDWRLPTITELISITNKVTTDDPAVYDAFAQTDGDLFWASDEYVRDTNLSWSVGTNIGQSAIFYKTSPIKYRCVRGTTSPNATYIEDTTSKVVYDTKTGLKWDNSEQTQMVHNKTWTEAKAYCDANNLDGLSWTLPTFQELESIVDYSQGPRPVDQVFADGTQHAAYWTSTEDANSATKAWTVRFSGGASELIGKTDRTDREDKVVDTFVRCVSR